MEKRKTSRVPFHAEAVVKFLDVVFSGTIDNLSLKGMFIDTEHRVSDKDLLDITVRLSGTDLTVNLKGRVIRQTDTGIAIEFREMDLDSFTHLKKIVEYNSDDADNIGDEYYSTIKF